MASFGEGMVPAAALSGARAAGPGSSEVLVLNQNFEPLNVTNLRRAIALIVLEKAEPLETNGRVLHSEHEALVAPSVVRLRHYVRRPVPELRLTRASVFARDGHTCLYCGRHGGGLTIDHVIPRARGGAYDWTNLVTCCLKCNNKKGNRTPQEAGMRLLARPLRPRYTPYISLPKFLEAYRADRWTKYLQPFIDYAGLGELRDA